MLSTGEKVRESIKYWLSVWMATAKHLVSTKICKSAFSVQKHMKQDSKSSSGFYIAWRICFGSTVSGCLRPTLLVSLQERCKWNIMASKSGTKLLPSKLQCVMYFMYDPLWKFSQSIYFQQIDRTGCLSLLAEWVILNLSSTLWDPKIAQWANNSSYNLI